MAFIDFFSYPGELRNMIYRLVLTTDPSELDRQHKYDCDWCTWDPAEPQHAMYDVHYQRLPGCRCWARSGLALLLANRKVNEEASSIFWAENHFTFRGSRSFIRLVGMRLRPRYRQMIRHITVLPQRKRNLIFLPNGHITANAPVDMFWQVVSQCKGLRMLEITYFLKPIPYPLTPHGDEETAFWRDLKSQLPDLKRFSWVYFEDFYEMSAFRGNHPYSCKVAKCLDIEGSSPEQLQIAGQFTAPDMPFAWALCVRTFPQAPYLDNVREAVVMSTERPNEYRCVVHQGSKMGTWMVTQFLLPLSQDTIARNSMLRARDERSKKTDNTEKTEKTG